MNEVMGNSWPLNSNFVKNGLGTQYEKDIFIFLTWFEWPYCQMTIYSGNIGLSRNINEKLNTY